MGSENHTLTLFCPSRFHCAPIHTIADERIGHIAGANQK